ncbi:hypothetical protein AA313_de0208734 [Arthrobotrys entomopaga]|nr:hypothetical protein AA313_de0208734 [Arthrobotrys entomopaga]
MASENPAATMTTDIQIEEVPAPWDTTSEAWWFTCYPITGNKKIYPGAVHPSNFEAGGDEGFEGGIGMIQIVRYSQTPVGPYDELIYIPGVYKTPHSKTPRYRITNIYVSSIKTTYNGRKNWNIPKRLAVFNFSTSETTGHTTISVAHPETPTTPFFYAVLGNIPLVSSIPLPLNSKYFGLNLEAHQPPLLEGKKESGEVATETWRSWTPWMSGTGRFVKCVELKNGNGDGTWPDQIDGVWGLVLKWDQGMKMKFEVGKEYPKSNL